MQTDRHSFAYFLYRERIEIVYYIVLVGTDSNVSTITECQWQWQIMLMEDERKKE